MNKTITIFITSFLLVFSSLCFASENVDIVTNEKLIEWGYKSKGTSEQKQSAWEKETFGNAKIYKQKIKALKELKDWQGAYYRFNLIHEKYDNEKTARNRFKRIYLYPPGTVTKMEPEYVLRSAFQIGSSIYLVTTDVDKFHVEELPRIKSLLKEYVTKNP